MRLQWPSTRNLHRAMRFRPYIKFSSCLHCKLEKLPNWLTSPVLDVPPLWNGASNEMTCHGATKNKPTLHLLFQQLYVIAANVWGRRPVAFYVGPAEPQRYGHFTANKHPTILCMQQACNHQPAILSSQYEMTVPKTLHTAQWRR